uniref:SBF2 domain-containing protein n=1 Tax=Macrostomum lignano TaxID=282301 RepID=A0A1I8GSD4_9PLAT
SNISAEDKAKFGQYCQKPTGRIWFARCVEAQRGRAERVEEDCFFAIVQALAIALYECNEADDWKTASTLMNIAARSTNSISIIFVKDQPIWQSLRFWNAAFINSIHIDKQSRDGYEVVRRDGAQHTGHMTMGQLNTFISNMKSFDLSREMIREFVRKQCEFLHLPSDTENLIQNFR